MMYAMPLESPPLLVVSDRLRIAVHTHFTSSGQQLLAVQGIGVGGRGHRGFAVGSPCQN